MTVTNKNNIIDCLREHQGTKFTAQQIAEILYEKFPEECEKKKQKSRQERMKTHKGLIGQMAGEINREITRFKEGSIPIRILGESPKKFYYSEQSEEEEIAEAEQSKQGQPTEKQLYPLLAEYLYTEFSLYSKRINESRGSNRSGAGGNKWLYPDLVSLESVSGNWEQLTRNSARSSDGRLARLWSFEVKVALNRSNIRENFFQTTSNSFWANYGYLVASEMNTNTLESSRMLFDAYGIGLMQLNIDSPTESRVIIPAKEREVNWDMVDRLVKANTDFEKYMKQVDLFLSQGGYIDEHNWDYLEFKEEE